MWNWGRWNCEVFAVELRGRVELRGFFVWSWGVFDVELRGFWCWTDGFLMWNWGIFRAEKVWSLCGTDVLNWGVVVELTGIHFHHIAILWSILKVSKLSDPNYLTLFCKGCLILYHWRFRKLHYKPLFTVN